MFAQQVNEPRQTLAGVKSGSSPCLQGKICVCVRDTEPAGGGRTQMPMVTARFVWLCAVRIEIMQDIRVKYTQKKNSLSALYISVPL